MLGRIFKTIGILVVVAVAGAAGFVRWKLEGVARAAAQRSLAGASAIHTGRVHVRVWPPAAILEDFRVQGGRSDEILRARRVVLPLAIGAWIGRGRPVGTPEIVGFVLKLRLPASNPAISFAALAEGVLPDWPEWKAREGRVELRAGDGPASASLVLSDVHAERQGSRVTLGGAIDGAPSGRATLDGEWHEGRFHGKAILGAFDATVAAEMLVDAPAVVRGGDVAFEGILGLDARHVDFRGDLEARDVMVEGPAGTPGAFESRLRAGRGRARVPVSFAVDLSRATDWKRVLHEAVASGAR